MDFGWTAAQEALREQVIAFARAELNDSLVERDREGTFRRESWQKCADFGILGSFVPEALGGRGRDLPTTVLVLEALGYGCRDYGLTLALNGQMWCVQWPIWKAGTEDQRRRYLPRLCSGEWLGSDAMTEPQAGSDVFAAQTLARPVEGGYRLTGHKSTIGLAPVADLALVLANARPERGTWGLTMFLVETASPGVRRGPARAKMGLRTAPLGDLFFEDVFVPTANRLGAEGAGMSLFQAWAELDRAFILASHVGSMSRQLDACVAHARERRQFGQPVGRFQAVSHRLADMRLRLETARLLLHQTAWLMEQGRPATLEASLTKLHLAESLAANSLDAVRLHGAQGYLAEFEVERELRDTVGGLTYAGTSDIQRNVIARLLGL